MNYKNKKSLKIIINKKNKQDFKINTVRNKSIKSNNLILKNKNKITYNNSKFKSIKLNKNWKKFSISLFPLLYRFKSILTHKKSLNNDRFDNLKEYNENKQKDFINNFIENFLLNYKYIWDSFKKKFEKRDQFFFNIIYSFSYNKDEIFSFFYTKKYVLKEISRGYLIEFIWDKNFEPKINLINDLKNIETKFKEEIFKLKKSNFDKSFNHLKLTLKNLKKNNKNININGVNLINKRNISNPYLLFDNNNIRKKLNYISLKIK